MACEVNNKEINSQCAELLVRPTYIIQYTIYNVYCIMYAGGKIDVIKKNIRILNKGMVGVLDMSLILIN